MSTPVCPSCASKFSHDSAKAACSICGLPDEVLALGDHFIQRWKKDNHIGAMLRKKREVKNKNHSSRRPRNKHGRKGVKS